MTRHLSRKFVVFLLLSFLVSNLFVKRSWAAKEDPSPDFSESEDSKNKLDQQNNVDRLDSVDIAKPPPLIVKLQEKEYFYPYSRTLSARFGGVLDSQKFSDKGFLLLAGVIYLYRHRPNEYYDFGFDVRNDNYGTIHAERRWISGRAASRPYAKAGLGLNLIPSDQLATFLKFQNYQIRGAVGIEKIFISPMSFRYEVELLQGEATILILSLGYSWGW